MISSLDNKQVKRIVALRDKARSRRDEGCFVVEGLRIVRETPIEDLECVFVSEDVKLDAETAGYLEGVTVETVSKEVFKKMSDTVTDQGILAVVKIREYDLEDYLKPDGLYLVLETIQDPGNLGTIMRTAEGAGVDMVIMSRDTVDIYSPKTVRATMGAIFRQPFMISDDLEKTIKSLKAAGITTYAAHLKGENSFWDEDFKKGSAFFIGNEGNGLTDKTAELADKYIKIPMGGRLESLNAAVSAALLGYEARRQRGLKILVSILLVASLVLSPGSDAYADSAVNVFKSESIGALRVFDPDAYNGESTNDLGFDFMEETEEEVLSNLVMANVSSALNVRENPDVDSKILGKIYKDCGGKVVTRGEEWSLIETGELVGWASNEYLLFDDEAEAMARDVGFVNAQVNRNAIFVKKAPVEYSTNLGILSQNALAEVISEDTEGWILIAYGETEGWVPKDQVRITFEVDHGETMAMIKERKRLEEEARLAAIRERESMQSEENVRRLLGALIQCEAGGEPYEGMLAVGAVVMNRVRSGAYPNTVYDVIYASGQFTPAKTGWLSRVYANGPRDICVQAAIEALAGYTNVGGVTHFRRAGNKEGIIIGHHVFY